MEHFRTVGVLLSVILIQLTSLLVVYKKNTMFYLGVRCVDVEDNKKLRFFKKNDGKVTENI